MSIEIHICNNDKDADFVIDTTKKTKGDPSLDANKLKVPDIMVFDHSKDVDNPTLANKSKVCVVISD